MRSYSGIVDSYATYIPATDRRITKAPAVPDFSETVGGEHWCFVDEKQYDDVAGYGFMWSPSVCTSDDIMAADIASASDGLLERHRYQWPDRLGGWKLSGVRYETVMDEEGADEGR